MFRKPWEVEPVFNASGFGGAGAPPAGAAGFADDAPDAGGVDQGQDYADPGSTDAGFSYIDDATANMLADDMPDGATVQQPPQRRPAPGQPGQPGQPRRPAAPQYPQPVQVPGQQTPQLPPGQVPGPQQALPPPQTPQPPPQTPEQQEQERIRRDPFRYQADLLAQQEAAYIDGLAQNVYPISAEDMDAFLSGDSTKVSQALARVHVNAVSSVMKVVSQHMPIWVGNMIKMHQTAADAEGSFWASAPYLNKEQHSHYAFAAARAVRQMNPQISRAELNKMVAAMTAAAAGIAVPAQVSSNPQNMHQMQGGVRTPGRVVRRTSPPFQPAGMQATAGATAPALRDNPWAETTDILLGDQAGAFDGQL